jgi:tetratricopeptide (TPR) repeat protein
LLFQTASTKERLLVWENTVDMIKEYPFKGVGGGNWQLFFPKYGLNEFHTINEQVHLGYQTFQRPHNDFLWVFSEAGILGFTAFLSIFAVGFLGAFLSYKKLDSIREKTIPLLFSLGIISYFVISFFDFPLERSEHVFIFILLLVFCIPLSKKKHTSKNTLYLLLILVPLLLVSGFSVYNTSKRMEQEKEHLKVLVAHRHGDWEAMLNIDNKSNSHVYQIDNYSIPREWYRGVALYSLGELEESRKAFENAYHLAPYQVHVINNLAGVYQYMGNHKKAIDLYDEALNIASYHSEILLNKSVALYNEKKVDAAFHNLLKLEYKKEHPDNYHRAMKVIFNAYLTKLKQSNTHKYNLQSLNNIQKSDSLKVVFLYEYQINEKSETELLNTFTMELKSK